MAKTGQIEHNLEVFQGELDIRNGKKEHIDMPLFQCYILKTIIVDSKNEWESYFTKSNLLVQRLKDSFCFILSFLERDISSFY